MSEIRSGREPIALPQDQVDVEPARGYWAGSGKVVWAAVLGVITGVAGLGVVVAVLTRNDLSGVPVWRFVFVVVPLLVVGAFLGGSVLLLCRKRVGKVLLVGASLVTAAYGIEESIRDGSFGREPRAFIEMAVWLLAIAGLAASKSAKRWLGAERG